MTAAPPRPRGLRPTLTDLLLVLGVLLLVGTYVWPLHRVDALVAAEERVAAWVAATGEKLAAARAAATSDVDGDGQGEFPPLGSLGLDGLEPDGPERFRVLGYRVALLRPDRRLQAAPDPLDAGSPTAVDASEAACVLMAWPERRGETGLRAFAWTPADGLLKHSVDGYPYDVDPPPFRGALVERVDGAFAAKRYVGEFWNPPLH